MSEILDKLEYTLNTMIIFCVYYQPRVSKNIRCQSLIATAIINQITNAASNAYAGMALVGVAFDFST